MDKRIRNLINSKFSLPLFVLFLSFICYGLLAPWFKFFHDELSILWFYRKMNDVGIFFEGNRPFLKFIYQPFLFLFSTNSFLWTIFSVFTRWLHAISLYLLIRQTWPEMKTLAVTSCLFAVVYPGFQAQFSSMIYGITFFIFSLFLLSLFFSIKIINNPDHKPIFLIISLFFSAVSLITSEYFFTLESVRYLLIWIAVRKRRNKSIFKYTFGASSPYLILYVSTIIWRLFQQNNETTYSLVLLENFKTSFFPTLINQVVTTLRDVWYTSIKVWLDSINPALLIQEQGQRIIFFYYGLILFLFITVFIFLKYFIVSNKEEKNRTENPNFLAIGIISLIFAGIPFWLSGLPVNEKYFFTRWTIPFIVGSCIVVPQLISLIFKNKLVYIILISSLISLGAGTQFLAANSFRHDWENQNQLYWELRWRIPSLKENTVIFSDMLDFNYENSDQLSSGINFALTNSDQISTIPYFLFYLPERVHTSILPELIKDIPITGKRYYSLFHGNTSQALIIDFNPPGCMKILDPELDKENPNLDSLTKQTLFLSKPELIIPNETNKPDSRTLDIIGSEPQENWCYYFEKADLASQFGNWDLIGLLYQDVKANDYKPRDGRELFPFIEGLSHLSKWEEAMTITDQALKTTNNVKPMLCMLWKRITSDTPETTQKQMVILEIYNKLDCK